MSAASDIESARAALTALTLPQTKALASITAHAFQLLEQASHNLALASRWASGLSGTESAVVSLDAAVSSLNSDLAAARIARDASSNPSSKPLHETLGLLSGFPVHFLKL